MEMVERAEQLARKMHAGQVDKAGEPYTGHLERVVTNLQRRWPDATDDEIAAAWLHDALEDTVATPADLRATSVSERTIAIVGLVTKPAGVAYLDWIRWLAGAGDVSALQVKLADNEDNSDPGRVAALQAGPRLLAERYLPARTILERALA